MGHERVDEVAEQQCAQVPRHGVDAVVDVVGGKPGMDQQGAQCRRPPMDVGRIIDKSQGNQQREAQPVQRVEPEGMVDGKAAVATGRESVERMPHRQQEGAGDEKEGHTSHRHVPHPAHAGMEQHHRDRHESSPRIDCLYHQYLSARFYSSPMRRDGRALPHDCDAKLQTIDERTRKNSNILYFCTRNS